MISRFRRYTVALLIMAFGLMATAGLGAAPAQAAGKVFDGSDGCSSHFLTFPTWFNGLPRDDNCTVSIPSGGDTGETLSSFIWLIVLNVIEIALQLMGYIAAGYIIFGGFRYLTSSGLPEKTVRARKTILNAIIGLVISFVSVMVVNLVAGSITAGNTAPCSAPSNGKVDPNCIGLAKVDADSAFTGILNTAYYAAGAAAIIVIIICAILYSISQGDATKTKRAKDGILYSVVGLIVIIGAFIITNFIIGRFT